MSSFQASPIQALLIQYSSYKQDFEDQYRQYVSQREIYLQAPVSATDAGIVSLHDLIDFVAHVADCFPKETKDFPGELIEILTLHHAELEQELREKIVGSLVLLRRKDVIDSSKYATFNPLTRAELTSIIKASTYPFPSTCIYA